MIDVAVETAESLTRDEVASLYDSVGWSAYTRDLASLVRALAGSHRIVTAREEGRLVGLARSLSDGETIVYVQDVLVRPDLQRTGVGRRLLSTLLETYRAVRQQVLLTDTEDGQRAFYESLGLTETRDMTPELRAFVRLR